jgi:ketosteroid isomerase-like protein
MFRIGLLLLLCASITSPEAQIKIKEKGGVTVAMDKSKPVRRGIEAWYQQNKDAFARKDLAEVMALRAPDFHTVTPDGKTNDWKFMEQRTRALLDRIEKWISQEFEIGTILVEGEFASTYMTQDTSRLQRFPDGTIHTVRARAIQRETFRRTANGWKLYKVDDITDLGLFIDGKRVSP